MAASATNDHEFLESRRAMVRDQILKRGVTSQRVLDAMLQVPRHEFVDAMFRAEAYADKPLSIGEGQTISQPYIVGAMTEALELDDSKRVLEIGAGSGYQAAVLSLLAREVITIEKHLALANAARELLARLGYSNVVVLHGDGSLGFAEAAPYDAILVTAAAPAIPPLLAEQLSEGGRLVIPVGSQENQELILVRKEGARLKSQPLFDCKFVPLRGQYGWK